MCVETAPGLVALRSDPLLQSHCIVLQIGNVNFCYKKTVTEHVIMELGLDCIHLPPVGDHLPRVTLALFTANLNSRICHTFYLLTKYGPNKTMSSVSSFPLPLWIITYFALTLPSHSELPSNAKSKAHGKTASSFCIHVGYIVYLYDDRDKVKPGTIISSFP